MKFVSFPKNMFKIFVFTHIACLAACRTHSTSGLETSGTNLAPPGSPWVLLPNLENAFGASLIGQTTDLQNPGALTQICLYFNRSHSQAASNTVQANMLQLWLEPGEFCSEWENPGEATNQHQFLGAKALEVKDLKDPAWVIYLDQRPIGNATIDEGTGLPQVQSLCTGAEFEKSCHIVATPRSIQIVPGT